MKANKIQSEGGTKSQIQRANKAMADAAYEHDTHEDRLIATYLTTGEKFTVSTIGAVKIMKQRKRVRREMTTFKRMRNEGTYD